MRKLLLGLATLLLVTGAAWAQSDTQQQSLAEAARKARAERARKDLSQVRMYTNDDIPKAGAPVSVMGSGQAAPAPAAAAGQAAPAEGAAATGEAATAGTEEECDETCWRQKFSEKRAAIRDAEREMDILQREHNLSRVQYYQDPNQAVREQYSGNTAGGKELQDLQNRINEKKQEVERLKQELSSLEDDLRRAGGEPGWAREQ